MTAPVQANTAHEALHSETGAQRRDRPDRARNPLIKVEDLAWLEYEKPDLLLTGTPGGTALKAPPKPVELVASLLPAHLKWKAFFNAQAKNPNYLRDGDVVEVRVATDDGAIDLGTQTTIVCYAATSGR